MNFTLGLIFLGKGSANWSSGLHPKNHNVMRTPLRSGLENISVSWCVFLHLVLCVDLLVKKVFCFHLYLKQDMRTNGGLSRSSAVSARRSAQRGDISGAVMVFC